jgi:enamine deaminase RidA (YjgF/YER057c/UK114 family)
MNRQNFSSSASWESVVGYSRAVRVGPYVHVAGTSAFNEQGDIVGVGDLHVQCVQILRNIERALHQAGAGLKDVVRTRVFLTDISQWEIAGRAHGEFFASIRPACTMVEIVRLVSPEMLAEIEADAILADSFGA